MEEDPEAVLTVVGLELVVGDNFGRHGRAGWDEGDGGGEGGSKQSGPLGEHNNEWGGFIYVARLLSHVATITHRRLYIIRKLQTP